MRDGGARSLGGSSVARAIFPGGRTIAFAFIALMIAPLMLSLVTDSAVAQKSSDPWWGPSSPTDPTGGWAIRIPIIIENNRTDRMVNAPVSVELDFTRILLDGGWTSQTVGADERLRGFTLDIDSIRVVEYGRGFASGPIAGPGTEPVPHVFYEAPLQGARTRDFDASRNPSGTLMFLAESLFPTEKRYYYIYANPLEFTKTAPATFAPIRSAPLDGYLWGTTGTVTYGYVPQQSNQLHRIQVTRQAPFATAPASVTVSEYAFSKFTPVSTTAQFPNPVTLTSASPSATFFVPGGKFFKVESAEPVAVMMHGNPTLARENFGYVPSTLNSYAGNMFRVFGPPLDNAGASTGSVTLIKVPGGGSVTVSSDTSTVRLTDGSPTSTIPIPPGWSALSVSPSTGRILVSTTVSTSGPFQGHAVPALTGGPEGTRFLAPVPPDGGFARVCTDAALALRVADLVDPNQQLYPPGKSASTPAAKFGSFAIRRFSAIVP